MHLFLLAEKTALADKRSPEMHRSPIFVPVDAKMTSSTFFLFLLLYFITQLSFLSSSFKDSICISKTFYFQFVSVVYSKAFCHSKEQRTNMPTNNVSLGYENQRISLLSELYSGKRSYSATLTNLVLLKPEATMLRYESSKHLPNLTKFAC